MLLVGAILVLVGIATVWIEPKWIPSFIRRALPHVGILILGWQAIADSLVIAHLDWKISTAPDSSLAILNSEVARTVPRTLATFLPPSLLGTPASLRLILQIVLFVAIGATILVFTHPQLLAGLRRVLERFAYTVIILCAAWLTGINSRAIGAVRARVQLDPHAPVSSIAYVVTSIPGEYWAAALTCFIIAATALYIEGLGYLREHFYPARDAA